MLCNSAWNWLSNLTKQPFIFAFYEQSAFPICGHNIAFTEPDENTSKVGPWLYQVSFQQPSKLIFALPATSYRLSAGGGVAL